jgi:hypothetical protein
MMRSAEAGVTSGPCEKTERSILRHGPNFCIATDKQILPRSSGEAAAAEFDLAGRLAVGDRGDRLMQL